MLKQILISFIILIMTSYVAAQDVAEAEKQAVAAVEIFCDKTKTDEERLKNSYAFKWLTPLKHKEAIAKIGVVASDRNEGDRIRIQALAWWFNGNQARASNACIEFLNDFSNGGLMFRLACANLTMLIFDNTQDQEYRQRLTKVLENVMHNRQELLPVRSTIIARLALNHNPEAVTYCVKSLAENVVSGNESCPIEINSALILLSRPQYIQYLRPALANPDAMIREHVVRYLINDTESQPTIVLMLQDAREVSSVRKTIASSLYMLHPEYPDLIIPLIEMEKDDLLKRDFIRSLHLCVRKSDWMADPKHRNRLKELQNLCHKWVENFDGESKTEAAIAEDHFRQLQKSD